MAIRDQFWLSIWTDISAMIVARHLRRTCPFCTSPARSWVSPGGGGRHRAAAVAWNAGPRIPHGPSGACPQVPCGPGLILVTDTVPWACVPGWIQPRTPCRKQGRSPLKHQTRHGLCPRRPQMSPTTPPKAFKTEMAWGLCHTHHLFQSFKRIDSGWWRRLWSRSRMHCPSYCCKLIWFDFLVDSQCLSTF